jgi:hypothetical protein
MKLRVALYDWYDNYSRKRISEKEYNYKYMFEKAIKNTKALGLQTSYFQPNNNFNSYINGSVDTNINTIISKNILQKFLQEEIRNNCFYFSELAQNLLKTELNIDSILTLGSVEYKGEKVFYESLQKLKFRLNNKNFKTTGIKLHAWLTLPDYSIIDISILSAFKCYKEFSEYDYRQFYYLRTQYQKKGETYIPHFPILVGNDYIHNISLDPIITFVSI